MTLLIFFSASARTRIISAHFRSYFNGFLFYMVLKDRNNHCPSINDGPVPAPAATNSSFRTFILLISVFCSLPFAYRRSLLFHRNGTMAKETDNILIHLRYPFAGTIQRLPFYKLPVDLFVRDRLFVHFVSDHPWHADVLSRHHQ